MAIQVTEQSFDTLMHELEESAMGKQLWRHYHKLRRHWLPLLAARMFDEDTVIGAIERGLLEEAVESQIAENVDLLRYMCWETTSEPILKKAELPIKIGEFAKEVLGRNDTTAIRGWRVRYPWLKSYLAMCSKTGKDILDSVKDDHFLEIADNAMDRENDKQVQWMKLATDIRGDKAPKKVDLDWRARLAKGSD